MKKLFFIVNIKAGNGRCIKLWNKLKDELDNQNVNYRSFFTKYPKHAQEISKQIATMFDEKIDAIIAVGGDGTIHEVVNGLVEFPSIKIGYIPAGSGNDFSRGFSIPKSPQVALSFILKNKHKNGVLHDIGKFKVSGLSKPHYFVSSLGAGFDAAVAKLTNESKMKKYLNKVRLGSLAYVGAVVRTLFTYERSEITVSIDGKTSTYQNVWFITISNQKYYGGGMKIAPTASTKDGQFDVTIVHNLSRFKLLLVFGSVFFGKHTKFKEVIQEKGTNILIDSKQKMLVHADGELIGKVPLKVSAEHKKMSFLVKK
ncbi:diacylglycerol/lipid kinase family protein [Ferdinandcohnia quinoae]|uniref:Diacylglycerol kinase family lipid kinase n=1 Tax=Fredinandcohnia quinoae TaxID=2918902 RepID=A0AAW5E9C4_9BACI|nr:diacylglycerol kinase family protein [Fredinandcohnia sp. SECRCQ15]MCH1625359.1 diacylglycerol kinase family lipid kinase [Fredinandcohnia sp. SECRCQ15]